MVYIDMHMLSSNEANQQIKRRSCKALHRQLMDVNMQRAGGTYNQVLYCRESENKCKVSFRATGFGALAESARRFSASSQYSDQKKSLKGHFSRGNTRDMEDRTFDKTHANKTLNKSERLSDSWNDATYIGPDIGVIILRRLVLLRVSHAHVLRKRRLSVLQIG